MAADYTVAKAVSTSFPTFPALVRGPSTPAEWPSYLPSAVDISRRDIGDPVTDHRSSFVRRLATSRGTVFAKTYEYASWGDRLRAFWRWTAPFRGSRAAREFDALAWMRGLGLEAPEPIAVAETRRAGLLCRATLVTAGFDGEPSSTLFPTLPEANRRQLACAIGELVGALHALGFRDGNLDLRNVIARRAGHGFVVAKIDSPRHRLVGAGRVPDRFTAADWRRLSPQLAAFGVADVARAAADARSLTSRPASAVRRS